MGEEGADPRAPGRRRRLAIAGICAVAITGAAAAEAGVITPTVGISTLDQRIVPSDEPGYRQLGLGPGEGQHVVREEGVGVAAAGREARRRSVAYFGQLSDFQLADEESPARVEFLDPAGAPFDSAFRPWEAMNAHIDDQTIRQLNAFAAASPVTAGTGVRAPMDFAINTGDSADSQQLNETVWVRELLEGGEVDPNSGIDPTGYEHPLCDTVGPVPGDPADYAGVQDHDDYAQAVLEDYFYDPDAPGGEFAGFPVHTGLMDRAQESFEAAGLDVPSYVAFGNHDALVQGSMGARTALEQVATGCIKPTPESLEEGGFIFGGFSAQDVLDFRAEEADNTFLVPPDPDRRFVSKARYKDIFLGGTQADGHGFAFIDPAEDSASRRAAGYYSFSPKPGLRMIAIDTVSEGGFVGDASNGNLDDPQFRWLERELEAATNADELVVVFGHHAPSSMTASTPDEFAPPCANVDPEADPPGCDLDPRSSEPIHLGDGVVELLHRYPHVIAWISGHSHVNRVNAFARPDGGGFWGIRVAAEADWPQQARLLELFDNEDGTLSLFGTIVDHAAPATAPAPGTPAAGFDTPALASLGRTLAYNDPQSGARACGAQPCGEGAAQDRNVELLIADPRTGVEAGSCANVQRGTPGRDRLAGSDAGDRLVGRGGRDRLRGKGGADCLRGGAGGDRLSGGDGRDRISGGTGNDRLAARDGDRDKVRCGPGKNDRATVDRRDRVRGCERVKRKK